MFYITFEITHRIHANVSIRTVDKLISWIEGRRDLKRDLSRRVNRHWIPHEYTIDQRHITVSFEYWRVALYGSPSVFLVSPIFIANRRSIPPTPPRRRLYCRGCALSLVLWEVAHFCANVRAVGLILWTLVGYQIAAQIWHARYFVSPPPVTPSAPFPDFPLPRPHILLARWSSRICMYASRARRRENVSRASSAKYGELVHTKARSKFAYVHL